MLADISWFGFESHDERRPRVQRGKLADVHGVEYAEDIELAFLRKVGSVREEREGDMHDGENTPGHIRMPKGLSTLLNFGMSTVASSINAETQSSGSPDAHHHARFGMTDVGLIFMSVIWGVNFSIVKFGLKSFDSLSFAGIRVTLAAVVLMAVAALIRSTPWPSRRDIVALAGLGLIGNGFYQLLFLAGMTRTRAGIAALLVAAGPAWIAIISQLLGREKMSMRGWGGIALQLIGVACVVGSAQGADTGDTALYGAGLIALGAIMWAIYTVMLQPYTKTVNPLHLTAITTSSGAVICLVAALPGLLRTEWSSVSLGAWGAVFYASFGAMIIAYMLYYRGMRILGATRTSMYGNLQPLIALSVASFMLGERPTGAQLLGAAFIMGGLLLSRTARVGRPVDPPPIPESA